MTCQETDVGGGPYVELRETHAAVVFLVGDRAYKMKKPVTSVSLTERRLSTRRGQIAGSAPPPPTSRCLPTPT